MFKKFGPSLSIERDALLKLALQWSVKFCPEFSFGHPNLHKCIGFVYWSGNCFF